MNWLARFKNPIFWVNIFLAIGTPVLTYFGVTGSDLTDWNKLLDLSIEALKNPYVVGTVIISLWNTIYNPATKGIKD